MKWDLTEICRPLREIFGTRGIDWKPVCKLLFGKIKTPLGVILILGFSQKTSSGKLSQQCFEGKLMLFAEEACMKLWRNSISSLSDLIDVIKTWTPYFETFWESRCDLAATKIKCRFLSYLWWTKSAAESHPGIFSWEERPRFTAGDTQAGKRGHWVCSFWSRDPAQNPAEPNLLLIRGVSPWIHSLSLIWLLPARKPRVKGDLEGRWANIKDLSAAVP